MISTVHLAGPPLRVGTYMTQRCLLCGKVLCFLDIEKTPLPPTVDAEGDPVHVVMVAKPLALVRVTDRATMFGLGPTVRTIDLVRQLENSAEGFAGEWELPPGTCVLEGRKSIQLKGGPLDSGYYHAPPQMPMPAMIHIEAGPRVHVYRPGQGFAEFVTTEKL